MIARTHLGLVLVLVVVLVVVLVLVHVFVHVLVAGIPPLCPVVRCGFALCGPDAGQLGDDEFESRVRVRRRWFADFGCLLLLLLLLMLFLLLLFLYFVVLAALGHWLEGELE